MPVYVMADDVEAPEWAPLQQVAAVWNREGRSPTLVVEDFMYMWRCDAPHRPSIHLYKHIWSRGYLNLDDAGHAYEYRGDSKDKRFGPHAACIYRLHRDLAGAVRRVGIHLVSVPAL